jgi:hypothetical protein
MNDFELGGRKFKIGKLNTFKQFHIVRRIAPILGSMMPIMVQLQKDQKKNTQLSEEEKFEQNVALFTPILGGLSKLSDEDSEFVLLGLLSCVETQIGAGWTKVSTDNMLMVQDLDLPQIIQIGGRVFAANFANFFASLPAAAPGAR